MAAYEVLNAFVTNAANDGLHIVAKLSEVILERLEKTIPMQQQIVSVEDRITLEEIQTSLTSVLLVSHGQSLPSRPTNVTQGYRPAPGERDQTRSRSYHERASPDIELGWQ